MNKGLTVLELMIIVAIMAIICAIAIPALQRANRPPPPPVAVMISKNDITHQETWRVPKECLAKFQGEHPNYVINSVASIEKTVSDSGTGEDFIYVITKIEVPAEAR